MRADAARNHCLVLAATERLLDQRPVAAVTTDDVATAAGVGKGTVFRRFGSREGLLGEVLARRTRAWLAELTETPLRDPDPRRRLSQFGPARFRFVVDHADLIVAAAAHGSSMADEVVRDHLRCLLGDLGHPADERHYWVSVLQVVSSTGLLEMLASRGVDLAGAERGWHQLVDRL